MHRIRSAAVLARRASLASFAGLALVTSSCGTPGPSPTADVGDDGGPNAVDGGHVGAGPDGGIGAAHDASTGSPDGAAQDAGGPPPSCPPPGTDAGGTSLVVAAGPGAPAAGGASTAIAIDGAGPGHVFDGVGAISGGGGNSRLLLDYPEPYRSHVLDYLFKPGFGAALQILKTEIGGDMNSTDGAEPSHMHTKTDLACDRGYEWWLMKEAKARNPNIKLYGLAWGAPGWVGGGNFWSQDMVDYLMKWLGCAKTNGLTIDYLGGWNERGYDKGWYENLHSTLAAGGYAIKVVGADDTWNVATDMASDPAFKAAVDIVGVHYPCGGDGAPATSCPANAAAVGLGIPLWASENGSQDLNTGAPAMIRAILRGYIDGRMTAYINWPLVAAIPPGLPWETMGLIQSNQAWSGWYEVGAQTWVSAQVTQSTEPGWSFIDSSSGYIGGNNANGSYVTLEAPSGGDYSVILETTTATQPQTLTLTVTGGLSMGAVHIWATDLGSGRPVDQFVHAADVTPASGGAFWVTLPPNAIVTISTVAGQGKGSAEIPALTAALLPYAESFEGYAVGSLAPSIADQSGAFDVEPCGAGRAGQCLRQMAPIAPIAWNSAGQAYNLIGTNDWGDYTVGAEVLLEQPGSVELIGRYGARDYNAIAHIDGYLFSVADTGAWAIVRTDQADQNGTQTTLASGTVAPLGTSTWHHIELGMKGATLTATIDGTAAGQATDATYSVGPAGLAVGLMSGSWLDAQFDDLTITPLGPLATAFTNTLLNRASGLALDVAGASAAAGASLVQSARNGGPSQTWQIAGDRSGFDILVNALSGKVIDALPSPPATDGGASGTLDQQDPDGGAAQHWTLEPTGDSFYRLVGAGGMALSAAAAGAGVILAPLDCASYAQEWSLATAPVTNATYVLTNHQTGWAVDVSGGSTASGGAVIQWPTNGGADQQWRLAAVTGGGFKLLNGNSRLALDANGALVDQATPSSDPRQVWMLEPGSSGYYTLASGAGGGVLESTSATQGDPLGVGAATGSAAQEWTLAP